MRIVSEVATRQIDRYIVIVLVRCERCSDDIVACCVRRTISGSYCSRT